MTDFYVEQMPYKVLTNHDAMTWSWITHDSCTKHRPSQGTRLTPLAIRLDKPTTDDVLRTQFSDLVVTDRAKRQIEAARLKGFVFEPTLASGPAVRDTNFWEMKVSGFGGFIRSECVTQVDTCTLCGWKHYDTCGTLDDGFDRTKWDDSDIFIVWPYGLTHIVSSRFVNALRSSGITGLKTGSLATYRLSGATPYDPDVALTTAQRTTLFADVDYRAALLRETLV